MATGFTRQSSFTNADVIDADPLNNEFNQMAASFDKDQGHNHDGSAANGGFIPLIKDGASLTSVKINGATVEVDISGQGTAFTFSKDSNGTALINGVDLTTLLTNASTFDIAKVNGLQSALDQKYSAINPVPYSIITGAPNFAPLSHTHEMSEIIGLINELASKYSASNPVDWDDITNTPAVVIAGTSYEISDINGLQGTLDLKYSAINPPPYSGLSGVPSTFAPSAHTHPIADIIGLQAELDGKQDAGGSVSYNDLTDVPSTFAPSPHTHVIADVTGLQAELDTIPDTVYTSHSNRSDDLELSVHRVNLIGVVNAQFTLKVFGSFVAGDVVELFISGNAGKTITLETQRPMYFSQLPQSTQHTFTGNGFIRMVYSTGNGNWRLAAGTVQG